MLDRPPLAAGPAPRAGDAERISPWCRLALASATAALVAGGVVRARLAAGGADLGLALRPDARLLLGALAAGGAVALLAALLPAGLARRLGAASVPLTLVGLRALERTGLAGRAAAVAAAAAGIALAAGVLLVSLVARGAVRRGPGAAGALVAAATAVAALAAAAVLPARLAVDRLPARIRDADGVRRLTRRLGPRVDLEHTVELPRSPLVVVRFVWRPGAGAGGGTGRVRLRIAQGGQVVTRTVPLDATTALAGRPTLQEHVLRPGELASGAARLVVRLEGPGDIDLLPLAFASQAAPDIARGLEVARLEGPAAGFCALAIDGACRYTRTARLTRPAALLPVPSRVERLLPAGLALASPLFAAIPEPAPDGGEVRVQLSLAGAVPVEVTVAPGSWHELPLPPGAGAPGAGPLTLAVAAAGNGEARTLALAVPAAQAPAAQVGPGPGPGQVAGSIGGGPIVLISLDTVRADHLSTYGYARPTSPVLDRLAGRGVTLAQAESPAPWTLPAHASLMASQPPADLGSWPAGFRSPAPFRASASTLAQSLSRAGYEAVAFTGGGYVAAELGFARGFLAYADCARAADPESSLAGIDAWLDRRAPDAPPFFLFFHTYRAHMPFAGDRFAAPAGAPRLERTIAVYDSGVWAADRAVGDLLERLDRRGLLARTLVVVVSDHGEELGDRIPETTGIGHAHTLYQELLHVPLVVAGPGIPAGRRLHDAVSLLDVAPTIAAWAGIPAPAPWVGRPLQRLWDGSGGGPAAELLEQFPCEGLDRRGVRLGSTKLILEASGATHLGARVYDLDADPGERRPLAVEACGIGPWLREIAARRVPAAPPPESLFASPRTDVEEQARLLGYVR